jgi:hypothetical protein
MNQFAQIHDLNPDEFEFKFEEFYRSLVSDKMNYDCVVYCENFNISIAISQGRNSVHFMDKVINDGNTKRTIHVDFTADDEEGYTLTLFKLNFDSDENDFLMEYDGIDSIHEVDLRRCSLDKETLLKMSSTAIFLVEKIKKDETVIKNVL